MNTKCHIASTLLLLTAAGFAADKLPAVTQIVLLGTGTIRPDPRCSGPATAIMVNGTPYLVDFGPGVVRRAVEAFERGVSGLRVENLTRAFVTHLHADHTAGYADLILSPPVLGRKQALEVWGPKGVRAMTDHILEAYREDIRIRTKGLEQKDPEGVRVNAHEIEPGVVYRDQNVTVKAIAVRHGEWRQAFGYRFQTPDRTIVISGDTSPSDSIIEACNRCDVLIHEAYTEASFAGVTLQWQQYRRKYHTSSRELAEIAAKARPRLLIIYHRENPGGPGPASEEELMEEIGRYYKGKAVAGHDLEVY